MATDEDTVSVTVQLALAFSVAPARLRLPLENVAVPLAQVVPGLAPFKFAGSALAATARPVTWKLFGFVIVTVRVEVDPDAVEIEVGEKAAVMEGAVIGSVMLDSVIVRPPSVLL
ncbi:hypothetical protein [Bradyrhizobium sp. OK095]|uniref:hypothetical protein n=1 Tax=Bradyrhizobium sp. OK095 TaxID=1882760 RepID=UPI001FCCE0BA|nr:hypothetical protein [Bradyrhizobium sp. OK095]